MPELLLELFSEEIPARLQRRAAEDLKKAVTDALVEAGSAEAYLATVARPRSRRRRAHVQPAPAANPTDHSALLSIMAYPTRLALEMAVHEEQERRAMAGELAPLEQAWREAEEIAAIADDLLLPASVGEQLDQLKARSTARAGAASNPSSSSGSATSS